MAVFGWALWPHPGRGIVGLADQDPEIFIWSFAWWEHAISSLTNPFVTNVVYYPVGVNLMWTASGPGLALVFAPLTALVGPTSAYNVAALSLPALTAWTAFLLCRYLTGSIWAAIVGGYLFGFSAYVVAHEYAGDPNLTVLLLPLVALFMVRYLRVELNGRGLMWRLGLLLAFQLMISTEVMLTLTLALGTALLIAFAFLNGYRSRLVSVLAPLAGSYAVAALLAAPFVVYLFDGVDTSKFVDNMDGDLLNIVLPTRLTAVGGPSLSSLTGHFTGNDIDRDLYLGVPTLLIFALYVWRHRREGAARFLAATLVLTLVVALGSSLRVDGTRIVALPWALVDSLPLLNNLTTTRAVAYASLSAGVAVALWIGSTRGRIFARPVVLPLLALASIAPAAWHGPFVRTPPRPQFFSQSLYKLCIPPGETLLVFPYGRFGDSMLWQAETGFKFKLAEGNLGRDTYPPSFVFADPIVQALQFYYYGPQPRPTMAQLKVYARRHHVDRIVSPVDNDYPSGIQMHAFGPLQGIGGVFVAPACGHDSLAGDKRRIPGQ